MTLVLETERLRLAPLVLADIDLALEMFTSAAVMKFIGQPTSETAVRRDMSVWTRRGGDGCIGVWCISDRTSGEKYGTVCLLPIPVDEDDTDWDQVVPGAMPEGDVEVGYFLKEAAWGKGYATEACRRLVRYAFEETPLREVVATLDDGNEASKRVLTKAGLTCRGRRRAYGLDGPDWRIRRTEWLAKVTTDTSRSAAG